jgi:tetratricopeptide (TPR) repeat protein
LLLKSPKDPGYQVALANTLLNTATLLAHRDDGDTLEPLYRRAVQLDRDAVAAAPANPIFQAELALALEDQGQFFLSTGRIPEAETVLREAATLQRGLLAGGRLKDSVDRYAARSFVSLGRALAAAGKEAEAEQVYREAITMQDRLVKAFPEVAIHRADLAQTRAGLADLLNDAGRGDEAEAVSRRAIHDYETLRADFPENPHYSRSLLRAYLGLVNLLCELDRATEADEPYRKALALESQDDILNNELAWYLAIAPEPHLLDGPLAVRLARKAVAARPQSGDYRNTLGAALYRSGDDRAAVTELETAIRLRAGGDSFDWFFLAMVHCRLGNGDQARAWFDRAVQWMDRHMPHEGELRRIRVEAAALLAERGQR